MRNISQVNLRTKKQGDFDLLNNENICAIIALTKRISELHIKKRDLHSAKNRRKTTQTFV